MPNAPARGIPNTARKKSPANRHARTSLMPNQRNSTSARRTPESPGRGLESIKYASRESGRCLTYARLLQPTWDRRCVGEVSIAKLAFEVAFFGQNDSAIKQPRHREHQQQQSKPIDPERDTEINANGRDIERIACEAIRTVDSQCKSRSRRKDIGADSLHGVVRQMS